MAVEGGMGIGMLFTSLNVVSGRVIGGTLGLHMLQT